MGQNLTGIGRYAVELSYALKALAPELKITLLNPYPDSSLQWYRDFPSYAVPSLKLVPAAASLGNIVLHRAALRLKLDILHDPCGIAPFLLPSRYKRVTTVHDAIPLLAPKVQPLATRLIFRTLIPATRYTADAVLTVSEAAAEDLTRYLGLEAEKVHVIPNGVAQALSQSPDEVAKHLRAVGIPSPYYLYVGNLTPRKNLARVITAFRLFREQYDAHLAIVGPKAWGADALSKEAADRDDITLTGFVSDEQLVALYRGAKALVFPSLYEGFGLPVLEAMSYGTPVLTSERGALAEVAGDAATLVNPESETAIFEAMVRLFEDEILRQDLRQRGLERVKAFSWQQTAQMTLSVYESLVNG